MDFCTQKMSWITKEYVKYPARNLHLGYQKLSQGEINRVVERLSAQSREQMTKFHVQSSEHLNGGGMKKSQKLDADEIDALVERLSKETRKLEDVNEMKHDRTIVTSYAWCHGKLIQAHLKPLDGTWH